MREHPLDRPVWASLNSIHHQFATGSKSAKRFIPDIGPFAAIADESEQSIEELAELLERFGSLVVAQAAEFPCPENGRVKAQMPAIQMLYEGAKVTAGRTAAIEPLASGDGPAMHALARVTNPGPFERRTHELGQFWGIKHDGKLVAMAGERLKSDGFVEVSGVCTDPAFEGRGYGKALCMHVCRTIQATENQPFLHAFEDNARAVKLYKSLGFVPRKRILVSVLEHTVITRNPQQQ